jgi:hypothetical protein
MSEISFGNFTMPQIDVNVISWTTYDLDGDFKLNDSEYSAFLAAGGQDFNNIPRTADSTLSSAMNAEELNNYFAAQNIAADDQDIALQAMEVLDVAETWQGDNRSLADWFYSQPVEVQNAAFYGLSIIQGIDSSSGNVITQDGAGSTENNGLDLLGSLNPGYIGLDPGIRAAIGPLAQNRSRNATARAELQDKTRLIRQLIDQGYTREEARHIYYEQVTGGQTENPNQTLSDDQVGTLYVDYQAGNTPNAVANQQNPTGDNGSENVVGGIAGTLTDAQVVDEQNAIVQQILDVLAANPDRMVKRPAPTGDQRVDDFVNELWEGIDYRMPSALLGRQVLEDWMQTNRPGDYENIYGEEEGQATEEAVVTDVTQLPGTGIQINPDGSVTSTSNTGVNNDPVTNTAGSGADTTNNPAGSGTNTGGTGMWPENPVEGQTHTNNGRQYIYRNGQWVLDTPDDGGVFRSGQVIRMPDGSIYIYDNPGIFTNVEDLEGGLPEGTPINWDFQQDLVEGADDGTGNIINAILGLFGLGGGGGGSMSQDQRQVLVNEIKDLLDVTIGDQTATVGDTSATVGDTSATVGDTSATGGSVGDTSATGGSVGDTTAEGGSATIEEGAFDVEGGVSTATSTIEEGAFDVEGGAGGSATIEEGAFDVTGGAGGSVGNVTTGASSATVEEGAIENVISDLITEGAITSAGGEGGAGGAGGAGGSVGNLTTGPSTSTASIAEGAVSNVFDTTGIGDAISSLGDTLGGTVGSVVNVLGDILGGQAASEEISSGNLLAGALADAAASNYRSDAFSDASKAELDFQKDIYGNALNLFRPFYEAGTEGAVFDEETGQLLETGEVLPEYVTGLKTGVDYSNIGLNPFDETDPGLRFLQDEMRRQVESSAAGRGRLNTGGTLTELQDRSAGIASARAGEIANINAQLAAEARARDAYDLDKLGALTEPAFNAATAMSGLNQGIAKSGGTILDNQGAMDAYNATRDSNFYRNLFKDLFGV